MITETAVWPNFLDMVLLPCLPAGFWIGYLLRVRWWIGLAVSLGVNMVCTEFIFAASDPSFQGTYLNYRLNSHDGAEMLVTVASIIIAANLAVALIAKIYRAIALQKTTAPERQRGAPQFGAWLSPVNVMSVVVIAICGSLGLNYSFIGVMILGILVLLTYPLIGILGELPLTEPKPAQAPADERQRVLALVEAGKISAEDGAELLTALAQSQAAETGASGAVSGPRRLMIAGAAVVVVGFFLPWFTLNLTQAMHDAIGNVQQNMQQAMPQNSETIINGAPNNDMVQLAVPKGMTTTIHGGDVRSGLGWIILLTAAGAAGLPFLWTPRNQDMLLLRNCSLAGLAIGTALLLYLLSDGFNSATTIEPGFLLAIAGYVTLWVGALREYVTGRSGHALPAAAAI